MAQYLTGVTRTRTLAVDIAFTDGGGTWYCEGSASISGIGAIWYATWSPYSGGGGGGPIEPPPEDEPGGGGEPTGRQVVLRVVLSGPTGVLGTIDATIINPTSLTGTVSVSIPTRELLDLGFIPGVTSGPVVVDAEIPWGVRAREHQNSAATVAVSILGESMTRTGTGSGQVGPGWVTRSYARINVGNIGSGAQEVTTTTAPTTGTTGAVTSTKTKSGSVTSPMTYSYTTSATASESSVSASSTVTGTGGGPNVYADATSILSPARECTINGAVYLMASPYPEPIKYRPTLTDAWVDNVDGSFTASVSQKAYDTLADVFEHTGTLGAGTDRHRAVGQKKNVMPWYWFTKDGNTYQAAMLLHGPKWNAIGTSKSDNATVDDGSTLTPTGTWAGSWSASAGGSVAIVSGAVKITGSSGKKAQRTITGAGKLQGYSRLRIRMRCSAASHTIGVRTEASSLPTTLGNKWSVTTGDAGVWTNLYIDLGAQTIGPDVSVWDKNYQVASPGPYQRQFFGGGVGVFLEDLGAGDYEIDEIEALMAPTMGSQINLFPGSRKAVGIGDCIQTLDTELSIPVLGPTGNPITTIVSQINAQAGAGWSATDLTPPTTPAPSEPLASTEIQKSNHPALLLGGDGLLWDGSAWEPSFASDGRGHFGIGNLPAQWIVYEAQWDWPETTLGGFLTGVAPGTPGTLGAGIVLGKSLWGRVLEPSATQTPGDATAPAGRNPASGVACSLLSTSGATLATTTTDTDGWFSFPALGCLQGVARLQVAGRSGWVEKPLHDTRSRLVVVRQAPPDGTLLAMAVSATGRVVRAYRDTDDTLLLEFWRRSGWDTKDTGLTVTGSGALAYDKTSAVGRLWLAIEDSGAIKTRYTDDEGDTWSSMTTIFSSGEKPALCHSPTGARHYFCVSSGALKTKALDSQDNVIVAESTIVASGVASSSVGTVHDGVLIHLTYRNTSNAVVSLISSDGGVSFS